MCVVYLWKTVYYFLHFLYIMNKRKNMHIVTKSFYFQWKLIPVCSQYMHLTFIQIRKAGRPQFDDSDVCMHTWLSYGSLVRKWLFLQKGEFKNRAHDSKPGKKRIWPAVLVLLVRSRVMMFCTYICAAPQTVRDAIVSATTERWINRRTNGID